MILVSTPAALNYLELTIVVTLMSRCSNRNVAQLNRAMDISVITYVECFYCIT